MCSFKMSKSQFLFLHINNNIHLELARLGDYDRCDRSVPTVGAGVLDFRDNIHTLNNLSKDNMATIQPISLYSSDKELSNDIHANV